jgi:hypothetical protein
MSSGFILKQGIDRQGYPEPMIPGHPRLTEDLEPIILEPIIRTNAM